VISPRCGHRVPHCIIGWRRRPPADLRACWPVPRHPRREGDGLQRADLRGRRHNRVRGGGRTRATIFLWRPVRGLMEARPRQAAVRGRGTLDFGAACRVEDVT
jgi:hypothetical protein